MVLLQNICYQHPNKDILFDQLNLSVHQRDKLALIGNNGSGKSTLLKIIAGELTVTSGNRIVDSDPYYVPQLFGQYNDLTIAAALGIADKLKALQEMLAGGLSESNIELLQDDWTIEERCQQAFNYWQLPALNLLQQMDSLSGGQKTKVFLAGIAIHQKELVLLDEPTNHLDMAGRKLLYDFILSSNKTFIVVSHDRKLLNQLDTVAELNSKGINVYGGNYDFYEAQKSIALAALHQDVKSKEKSLRKAEEVKRVSMERQQKLDARGKKKQEKAGVPTIMLNTLKNNAEKSTAKLKGVHAEKTAGIVQELKELKKELPGIDKMKFGFDNTSLHKGKIFFKTTALNFSYGDTMLWPQALDVEICSGERIALNGSNGSGKTTLINIILGKLVSITGKLYHAINRPVYIDQDYSLIDDKRTVYEQAQQFNETALQEHEIKIRLTRFLFTQEDWNKSCKALSGGEKMRLLLCCLTIAQQSPDIIVLDEPTNNLDMQNIEILIAAIKQYQGTLILVSHDAYFKEQVNIEREIMLSAPRASTSPGVA